MPKQRDAQRRRSVIPYESKRQPLLSRAAFARRIACSFAFVLAVITVSLLAGMCGYHFLEHMPWVDSFANAAMILSGMGPLTPMETKGGKLFAGFYALYSGLALILSTGVLLGPLLHRVLHKFHLSEKDVEKQDDDDDDDGDDDKHKDDHDTSKREASKRDARS